MPTPTAPAPQPQPRPPQPRAEAVVGAVAAPPTVASATNTIEIFFNIVQSPPALQKPPPVGIVLSDLGQFYGLRPVDCGDSVPDRVRLRCSTLYDPTYTQMILK